MLIISLLEKYEGMGKEMQKCKEYKCYKGMEMEECCKSKVEEAVKNRTYIIVLIISIALMILALTVKTASSAEFVGQVSFASTVTSIVLSVIAIWMSITGERSTNEIKNKVTDAVANLMKTTEASKQLSDKLESVLNDQSKQYDTLLEKMQNSIDNSEGIKETLFEVKNSFGSLSINQEVNGESVSLVNTKNVTSVDMLTNVLDCIRSKEVIAGIFDTVDYVMDATPVPMRNVVTFMQEKVLLDDFMRGYILGVVYACSKNGLLLEVEEYIKIKDKYLSEFENNQ